MGANAGPDIVSDGLVLALDAADNNSFRGEPTTNTASTDTARTFFKHDSASVMTFSDAPEKGEGWKKIIITERSANNFRRAQFPYISHPDGVTRTYSLEYDVGNLTGYGLRVDGTSGYNTTAISGQGKYTVTITPSGTKTAAVFLTHGSGLTTGLNDIIYYRYYQVENKSTATRFTTGTRGTTVATGGGWADISGNDNHGEILNGTSTSNDGSVLGALDFDGTNDYIDINSYTAHHQDVGTLEAVVYLDVNSGDRYVMGVGGTTTYGASRAIRCNGGYWSTVSYGSSTQDYNSIVAAPTGTWQHIAFAWSGTTVNFYLNGTLYSTTKSGMITPTGTVLRIGNPPWSTSSPHNGLISIAKHYNRALSTTEIQQNYNSLKTRFGL